LLEHPAPSSALTLSCSRVVAERLATDEPFTLADGSLGFESTTDGNAGGDQAPTCERIEVVGGLVGQTAGDETCAAAW
jgi:hypothetical protein